MRLPHSGLGAMGVCVLSLSAYAMLTPGDILPPDKAFP